MDERERMTERLRLLAEVREAWLSRTNAEFRYWLRREMKVCSDWSPGQGR